MRWSNKAVKPSGIFLDDDIYSEHLANFIRTTVVPLVLTKESKEVGPFTKDQGIKDVAVQRDLLILTRNKLHFRGIAKSCGEHPLPRLFGMNWEQPSGRTFRGHRSSVICIGSEP